MNRPEVVFRDLTGYEPRKLLQSSALVQLNSAYLPLASIGINLFAALDAAMSPNDAVTSAQAPVTEGSALLQNHSPQTRRSHRDGCLLGLPIGAQ
ncbi:MAG TPA: hypothetical protein V6D03_06855 [Candidatus Caenarcaniphilales bacterium]